MSDNEEQIHYITLLHLIPPFFGAILGGLLGLLTGWLSGLNAFLCLAIGGYSSTLIVFAIIHRLGNDRSETEPPQRITWRAIRFVVSLYLVVATVALIFVAMWPLKCKTEELRERTRQAQPQAPRG